MSFISNILDFPKLAQKILKDPRLLIGILIFTGIIIFTPKEMLTKIGINGITDKILPWLGCIFLASAALLISIVLFWIWGLIARLHKQRKELKYAKENLKCVSSDEKKFLSYYLIHHTKSRNARMEDGVVNSLENSGIIYRASNMGRLMTGFAYNLQPWAWEELKQYPELLEPELSEEKNRLGKREK